MAETEPRIILALFDGRLELTPAETRIHRFVELPLNHLGYVVRYLDVSSGDLTEPVDLGIAGAISWFDAPLGNPEDFAEWAVAARADCPDDFSFIVLGQTGLLPDIKPLAASDRYLRRLGIIWTDRSTLLGDFTDVELLDPSVLGFESDFIFQPGRYGSLRALTSTDSALRADPSAALAQGHIDLVVLHHPNAYVHQSATLNADSRANGNFWIMDPFAILERSLSRNRLNPVADVTTINGRRIYFETVGPEGWLAPAVARTFDEEPQLGSENLLEKLIDPFPDLPVTVSVVTGDLDPKIGGKFAKRGRSAAKDIFAAPQVATGTSGRSLVRHWAGVSGTRQAIARTDPVSDAESAGQSNRLLTVFGRSLREAFADPLAPAEPELSDNHRQYGEHPFDLGQETVGAIATVRELAPNRSAPPLFLWSGDGKPAQTARAAVAGAGSPAIGGGATILGVSLSVSGLSPFSLLDGPQMQVYHAQPGDLGNLGYPTKDAQALHNLTLLVKQTDVPLRLKPFQLAYSAGSANQFAVRGTIEHLKRMAISGDNIPIFAWRYVQIVEGFVSVKFKPEGNQSWRIMDRGGLHTIRFDNAQDLSLNMAESEGTLGARRINGSLYVSLNPATVAPLVALSTDASPSGITVPTGWIGLSESNLEVVAAKLSNCVSEFAVTGWGQGELGIYGDPGAQYQVSISAGSSKLKGTSVTEAHVAADISGFAVIGVPTRAGKIETVTLLQDCAG